jgi:hypothetical protein
MLDLQNGRLCDAEVASRIALNGLEAAMSDRTEYNLLSGMALIKRDGRYELVEMS